MKILLFTCITLLISTHALADTLIPRSVSGDKGKYYLIKNQNQAILFLLCINVGVDSVGYTSTKINCKTQKCKKLDTVKYPHRLLSQTQLNGLI
jgi:predicted transcriptional regulator YheO